MTDDQLLTQAKQLNPAALQELHERFYKPVARYIQFKVGDIHTVEDLSGEVFVRVLDGLRKGQSWKDSPRGWIMGIARHVVADYYRKKERMAEVELNERIAATAQGDPISQVMRGEQKERLLQAIQQLTDDQRDVILLRFIEGVDIKGVAKAIDKTPGAVKLLQYRALQSLAKQMQAIGMNSALGLNE